MNPRVFSILPMLVLFLLTTASLYFMAGAAQNQERFDERYLNLIYFNILMLVVLLLIIAYRGFRLYRDIRIRQSGSRLTWRMVLSFLVVALLPVLMVFWFSTRFLGGGIDTWFDLSIDDSMEDAMELSDVSLSFNMESYRRAIGAEELTLLGRNNRIIATGSKYGDLGIANFPTEDVVLNLAQERNFRGLEPQGDGTHVF